MDLSKDAIIEILMRRDGMLKEDAEDVLADTQDQIDDLLASGCEGFDGVQDAENIIADMLGLEPDYLMVFI